MGNVEVIYNGNTAPVRMDSETKARTRVAAYCRVSTDSDGQMTSLELQMSAFKKQIEMRPDWELVDIYADEGISGTGANKRTEFQRMIRDCEAGRVDYIITKSISRFARNTLECLQYIRHLQSYGVQLLFEKENIDTGTAFSEMLLTILAAFAQEESRSISENVKWGIRKRFEAGSPKRSYVFGYKFDEEGNYVIVPEQAETVHRIFDMYETGRYSMKQIGEKLEEEGRRSAFCDKWDPSHVHCILYNEKYVGDVMMQKKYTMDHLSHKIVKNKEHTLPSYYVRDHHEPIISRKQFERVQKIAALKSRHGQSQQYPYDELLVCPVCGERLIQHKLKILDQGPAWFCDRNDNSCGQYVVKTRLLDAAMLDAYTKVDMEEVRAAGNDAAQAMIEMKQKYPRHRTVEYFWLDELVNKITFGKALAMTVHWKYGGTTTVTLPVKKPQDDPLFVARALRERREQNVQNKKPKKAATQKTEKYTDLADAFR